jgi:hypothetical protein
MILVMTHKLQELNLAYYFALPLPFDYVCSPISFHDIFLSYNLNITMFFYQKQRLLRASSLSFKYTDPHCRHGYSRVFGFWKKAWIYAVSPSKRALPVLISEIKSESNQIVPDDEFHFLLIFFKRDLEHYLSPIH